MLQHLDILDHVAQPVFVLTPDSAGRPVYSYWKRACEIHGKRPRALVLGKTAVEVYGEALGGSAMQRHIEALDATKPFTYEVLLGIGEQPTEVQTTLSPVRTSTGQLIAIIGSSIVLSSVRAAQQREIETFAIVERARAEMEQYLAFAAHDLRAPMRRMMGLAEMLRDDLPEDAADARETALLMEEVSRKAQELITDVLKFSETTHATRRVESFDLAALAHDIFTVLDPLGQHDMLVEASEIIGDRTAVQIILRNLVDNAIKHSDKEIIQLRISLENTAMGLDLLVADDGPGLPDGDLAFLDGKDFHYGQGFGLLGLRRLLEMRKGHISATPRAGGGTVFRVTLPDLRRAGAVDWGMATGIVPRSVPRHGTEG